MYILIAVLFVNTLHKRVGICTWVKDIYQLYCCLGKYFNGKLIFHSMHRIYCKLNRFLFAIHCAHILITIYLLINLSITVSHFINIVVLTWRGDVNYISLPREIYLQSITVHQLCDGTKLSWEEEKIKCWSASRI